MGKNNSLPRYVKVGPYKYKINYVDDINKIIDPYRTSSEKDGFTFHQRQEMYICTDMAHDMLSDTLLHETLHAIIKATAYDISEDDEEDLVAMVTPVLLQVLRDNPTLISFICRREYEDEDL